MPLQARKQVKSRMTCYSSHADTKCRPYRKDNISGNNACFRGEKEMSPEVSITKVEIYQGQAEVGKMISLQSEKWMTPLHPA